MPKILLSPSTNTHVFSIKFPTEDGIIDNRKLPTEDQVIATYTVPSPRQKERLRTLVTDKDGNSKFKIDEEACADRHCTKITGLSAYGITDGKTLVEHASTPELNEIMTELAYVVIGVYKDPDIKVEEDEDKPIT